MPSADGRCDSCGVMNGVEPHQDGCPAAIVRVTDKREERRQEAELKRLQTEAARLQEAEALPPTADVFEDEDVDRTLADLDAAHKRIAELRALDRALGKDEQDELLAAQATIEANEQRVREAEVDVIDARTAFLVVVMPNGETKAYADCNTPVTIEREASFDEMYAACSIVNRDIEAAMTSKHVIFGIQVAGQAMAEKSQVAKMAQRMQGMPSVPPRRR